MIKDSIKTSNQYAEHAPPSCPGSLCAVQLVLRAAGSYQLMQLPAWSVSVENEHCANLWGRYNVLYLNPESNIFPRVFSDFHPRPSSRCDRGAVPGGPKPTNEKSVSSQEPGIHCVCGAVIPTLTHDPASRSCLHSTAAYKRLEWSLKSLCCYTSVLFQQNSV